MEIKRLICFYKFKGVLYETPVDSISLIRDGFWVNEDMEFCNEQQSRYWIPANKVAYVEKREYDVFQAEDK